MDGVLDRGSGLFDYHGCHCGIRSISASSSDPRLWAPLERVRFFEAFTARFRIANGRYAAFPESANRSYQVSRHPLVHREYFCSSSA